MLPMKETELMVRLDSTTNSDTKFINIIKLVAQVYKNGQHDAIIGKPLLYTYHLLTLLSSRNPKTRKGRFT